MPIRPSIAVPLALFAILAGPRPSALAEAKAREFSGELQLLNRVVACRSNDAPMPADWQPVVERHCKRLSEVMTKFRTRYVDRATPFLAKLKPARLPNRVVYPFGGGDLVSALVTYPEAVEVTTMSLEHAGDPTRLEGLSARALDKALRQQRRVMAGLLTLHDSTTVNLQTSQRGPLPGQLSFFLVGLAALDYEVTGLRYFKLNDDGTVHYYSAAEVSALDDNVAKRTKRNAIQVDHSLVFSNSELVFRKAGKRAVHRHMAANLDNGHFADSPLSKHIKAKGEVVALTKAASYLLWMNAFSAVRDYLLENAVFMVSDSSGIPPRYARKAGLVQTTYGRFTGPFLNASKVHGQAFFDLWKQQPRRKLPFRYGYPDSSGNIHMLVTQRPGK